jgi:hypothetical protein
MDSSVVAQPQAGHAMTRRANSVLAAALGLFVGLTGCAAPGATVAPGANNGRAGLSVPDQPLAKARTYPTASIELAPPNGRIASVPATVAYDLCRTGVADCPDGQPTSAELASMTDASYGTTQSGGTFSQPLNGTLVWAFSWRNITCPPSSGGAFVPGNTGPSGTAPVARSSEPSGTNAPTICDEVAFVDAASGEFLITYIGPPAP